MSRSERTAQVSTWFHETALAAGASDNGSPGLREMHEHYYAAFVIDPDGHNIEAVSHQPA